LNSIFSKNATRIEQSNAPAWKYPTPNPFRCSYTRLSLLNTVEIPKVIGRNKELSIDKTITIIPVVRITTPVLIEKWIESEAYLRILDFIMSLNTSCMNIKSSDDTLLSDNVKKVLSMLDIIDTFVDEIPPDQSSQRFGNTAFRTWITKLRQTPTLHTFVPDKFQHFIPEIELYIFGSFGDQTRLDYGSGHELSFVAWLACLDLLGLFTICDYPSLVTKVFTRYLKICRRIQLTYNLEPAGSHGVWGLDDYQFLPYYWGSSQLIDHVCLFYFRKELNQRV
jgi:serine/threonine-protein phosphatase 2A activator